MGNSQRFIEEIHTTVLVGDGAIGTELLARGATPEIGIERLNLINPDTVLALHQEYVAAGSRVIETNTFNASRPALAKYGAEGRCCDILLAGVRLARTAATQDVYVAGSIGPVPLVEGEPLGMSEQSVIFQEIITTLLEGGIDLLMFETFTDLDELANAVAIARSVSDVPIVAQMAFEASGKTAGGESGAEFVRRSVASGADIVGANCGEGVPSVIEAITNIAPFKKPMSAYMNAGFAEQVENRRLYLATQQYLADRACQLVDMGVRLVGGCCGTGPAAIRAIAKALAVYEPAQKKALEADVKTWFPPREKPAEQPAKAPRVPTGILVELDPPKDLNVDSLISSALQLKHAGIISITVADNPLASACADAVTVAGLLKQQMGVSVIPHLTGRDRNRIALQSTIMGAHILGIESLLCVTGDPVRMYNETNTSGVFDLTSIGLVKLVTEFNKGQRANGDNRTAFSIGVALNPNVRNLSGQINKLIRKIEAGAHFVVTQPIFEERRFYDLKKALDDAGISIPVFIGILPLRSARNADFLHNEVPGILIPEEIQNRLRNFTAADDQRLAGIEIAFELIEKIAPHVHSFYLIAPRNQVDQIIPIIPAAQT